MSATRKTCLNCGAKTRTLDLKECKKCHQPFPVYVSNTEHEETVSAANADTDKTNGGTTNTMDNKRNSILDTILRILMGILLIVVIIFFIKGCGNPLFNKTAVTPTPTATTDGTTKGTTAETTTANTVATTAATTETTAPTTAGTTATTTTAAPTSAPTETLTNSTTTPSNTHVGLDYPMETWVLIKAGSVLSADAAIWDGDNNNKKSPIYDGLEGTADIIYFASDTYIWLEWGGHLIENASPEDIVTLINDKVSAIVPGNTNTYTVRYFANFTKLGDHNFVTYETKVSVSNIATK